MIIVILFCSACSLSEPTQELSASEKTKKWLEANNVAKCIEHYFSKPNVSCEDNSVKKNDSMAITNNPIAISYDPSPPSLVCVFDETNEELQYCSCGEEGNVMKREELEEGAYLLATFSKTHCSSLEITWLRFIMK